MKPLLFCLGLFFRKPRIDYMYKSQTINGRIIISTFAAHSANPFPFYLRSFHKRDFMPVLQIPPIFIELYKSADAKREDY